MILNFKGKKITDIVSVVPSQISRFDDEIENYSFSRAKCMKLKEIMGFDEHRIAPENITASDLCEFAFNHLVENKGLQRESIDAMIFVTHTPDHFIPPTSSILHGKLGLKEDSLCFDINHGCAGFIIGLQQAFMLLEQDGINKVALLNGDTLSRKINNKDRNSFPVVGDAGAVTIIENDNNTSDIKIFTKNRGKDAMVLKIPAGAFRMPSNKDTSKDIDVGDGNFRSLENLNMEGASVFSFVQLEVPLMVDEILKVNNLSKDDVDYYMFHQPNKFMLEKLADKIEVAREKMPNNIVEIYGNSNSVTIPVNITHNLGSKLLEDKKLKLCLAGFGVGLTWASMILDMGSLNSCEIIEYEE
ncbi:3-oxoacyl-[acyl-carrier-protein] synthase III [Aliarcobacter faecis]|uniref:3-oxoacyl-[acyl-carrier-protein] synthase III C-terminal domain-containing protein n=1 Tax=Aliarcobacter faecis TaxID=1564138 RepID=UPI00047CCEC7|nr:3-oxoacyl-[acyl-carrier-protein] synthase III C-terminal domain-containing protein [Aliarcobacter faecis]QKF73470.1 3-oxoacyl-[acyl-carrier-protein] synthase III [Aliarcobacter faecis]